MIDLALLESRGVSAEAWKKLFTTAGGEEKKAESETNEKRKAWRNRVRLRVEAERNNNISRHRLYHAMDVAWETPVRQINPTLLQWLIDRNEKNTDQVNKVLTAWGFPLDQVFREVEDPKTGLKTKKLDIPTFFQVFVPLARAYVTIRLAKLMNDRRLNPFLKFEPSINNATSRARSEALTSRVDVMSRQYGHYNTVKQAVFQFLHYGFSIQFPVEEWTWEDQEAAKAIPGITFEEGGKILVREREGLRYHVPHPSRTFFDEAFAPSTMNSDSGCSFCGYWRVLPYRVLQGNKGYYNQDKISVGSSDWWTSASVFFNTVYNACVVNVPTIPSTRVMDREAKLSEQFYSTDMSDSSVVETNYFEKFIPSECGLGDYDYPIWGRFVLASTDTILYGAPLPYAPAICYWYEPDESRSQPTGLTLEALWSQDQFSNLLTQYLLAIRENLTNLTFVDENVVTPKLFEKIRNLGHQYHTGQNLVRIDFRQLARNLGGPSGSGSQAAASAMISHRPPPLDTNGILLAMKTVLDTIERTLGMSSQELAQAASHELRAGEVHGIQQSTSTRLKFTGNSVEDALDAMKRQIYHALMAYGQDEFYAHIPSDLQLTPEQLEKMGFTWNKDEHPVGPSDRKMKVKARKSALMYESFTSAADGEERLNNTDIAMAMANALAGWLGNPILGPAIGSQQGIDLVNLIARLAGFPREFKLNNATPAATPEQQAQMVQQQIGPFLKQIHDSIIGEVQQGLKPMLEHEQKQDAALVGTAKKTQELAQIVEQMQAVLHAAAGAPQLQNPDAQLPITPAQPGEGQLNPALVIPAGSPPV